MTFMFVQVIVYREFYDILLNGNCKFCNMADKV